MGFHSKMLWWCNCLRVVNKKSLIKKPRHQSKMEKTLKISYVHLTALSVFGVMV